jgi:hypothetical protein
LPKPDEYGETLLTCYGGPFQFPATYSVSDEKTQKFFQRSQGFAHVSIHNVSKIDILDASVSLPAESIVEVVKQDNFARSYPPGQVVPLGTIARGEAVTILVWSSRPFALNDTITYSSRYGGHQWKAEDFGMVQNRPVSGNTTDPPRGRPGGRVACLRPPI